MTEKPTAISVSKGGKAFMAATLHDGPQVVSRAVLTRIDHNSKESELCLKVGRYKKPKTFMEIERPESLDPKSELSLSEQETNALLEFLKENASLVVEGQGTYVKVADQDLAGFLAEVSGKLAEADKSKLLPLIQTGKFLPPDVLSIANLRSQQDALEEFRALLEKNGIEGDFQRWFQKNDWVLGSDCVCILDDRKIDVANVADYLVKSYDGHADVIEIKRPGLKFWASEEDHGNLVPHSDLVKAITQTVNYQFELEREMNDLKTAERLKTPIAKPSALLIHGRSLDWEDKHFRAQRLLNASYSSVRILTYDQVLTRAERILSHRN